MLAGADFALYCVGTGALLVSVSAAARLLWGMSAQQPRRDRPAREEPTRTAPPTDGGLNQRLLEFQRARFAAPVPDELLHNRPSRRYPPAIGPRRPTDKDNT